MSDNTSFWYLLTQTAQWLNWENIRILSPYNFILIGKFRKEGQYKK